MLIRAAISTENNNQANTLANNLIALSINMEDREDDVEFDIAFFKDDMLKLAESFKSIDIAFISYDLLKKNTAFLNELYHKNPSCISVPVGEPREKICDFLLLRPAGHINSPEDAERLRQICLLCKEELSKNDEVLQIKSRKGAYSISLSTVIYCQSDLKYTSIVSEDGKIYRRLGKLDKLAEFLPNYFIRIHQSFLVNLRMVKDLDKTSWEVITKQGDRLPVSRAYHKSTENLFKNAI